MGALFFPPQTMSRHEESLAIPAWLPWLFALAALATGLGSHGLLDNNEGLYAQIGREMARGSSIIIPHVLGVPYMEKPPLLYYLLAISFRVLGETELAARLVPLAASLLTLGTVQWFCSRLGRPQVGRLAILILSGSLGYMLMSGVVMFDMLFTAFLTPALFLFFLAWREANRRFLRLAAASLALALLTKGILALALFGLALASYFLIAERQRTLDAVRFSFDPWAVVIFLALALPWHVAASLEHPRFAWFYFWNEHVLRFLGKRIPHDYYGGPWHYYLPRMLAFLFPWTAWLALSFFKGRRDGQDRTLSIFLWTAWLMPLAFFSLSSAKANYYMVLAMPALAISLAWQIESLAAARRGRLLALPLGLTALAGLAAVSALALRPIPGLAPAEISRLVPASAGFLVLALAGLWLAWQRRLLPALLAAALLMAPIKLTLSPLLSGREAFVSARPLAEAITAHCPGCRVLIYKDYERISSLPFYLPKPPAVLDSESNDLWFAFHEHAAAPAFAASDSLARQPGDQALAIVVLKGRLADFAANPLANRVRPALNLGQATLFLGR